ncbi:MAG: hypothetical protein ACRDRZ_08465, partial [Pseudonocardiaceae bacterium]
MTGDPDTQLVGVSVQENVGERQTVGGHGVEDLAGVLLVQQCHWGDQLSAGVGVEYDGRLCDQMAPGGDVLEVVVCGFGQEPVEKGTDLLWV